MPLHVQISADTGAVTLPIICHWFSKDLEGKYYRTCVPFLHDITFWFVTDLDDYVTPVFYFFYVFYLYCTWTYTYFIMPDLNLKY